MNNTEQAFAIIIGVLMVVQIFNFAGDKMFRDSQITMNESFIKINENFVQLHETAVKIDMLTTSTLMLLDEKINIIMDELFDRIWEDLEQT